MCFSSGSSADNIAQQQRADETAREQRINSGMASIANIFGGFNDDFYKKRYGDYMSYATPQIDQQAGKQRAQMIFDLARTGNLDSSAAADKSAELTETTNQQKINAANEGLNQENSLRSQVEGTRSNLVSELNATGNDQAASDAAMRATQNLNQPAGFSPLAGMFNDFANSLSMIGSRAGNGYSGFMGGGSGVPLFSTGAGSQRVIGG